MSDPVIPAAPTPPGGGTLELRRGGDLLPDSRLKHHGTPKGRVFTPMGAFVPVFCANCGKEGGLCPEENMNFLFYQCNDCAQKYGQLAGTLSMPDEIFWEQVKQEQLASFGRYLTDLELAAVVEADASPLATLIKGRAKTIGV